MPQKRKKKKRSDSKLATSITHLNIAQEEFIRKDATDTGGQGSALNTPKNSAYKPEPQTLQLFLLMAELKKGRGNKNGSILSARLLTVTCVRLSSADCRQPERSQF